MKKLILIFSIAFSSVGYTDAQTGVVVKTPTKRVVVKTRPGIVAPIARVVVVRPAPVVVARPVVRRRVVLVHH